MKKSRLLIGLAFILYILGVLKIIHWNWYWNNNNEQRQQNYFKFIENYRESISKYIPAYKEYPYMLEIISVFIFCIAGYIFIKQKTLFFKILAISSFLLAFWNLFSLM
jgi:hypothetical protein